jgi:hypothetical protein
MSRIANTTVSMDRHVFFPVPSTVALGLVAGGDDKDDETFSWVPGNKTERFTRGRIQRKTWFMAPYAGVDNNLTFYVNFRVDSNTFTMGIGQPYARVDLNPMLESTLSPSQASELLRFPLPSSNGVLQMFTAKRDGGGGGRIKKDQMADRFQS